MKVRELSLAISAVLTTSMVMADDSGETTPVELDEIIVTANKMESSIQDIATSISVISDIDIEDKGINNIDGVIKQIPNLSQNDPWYQRYVNFRGINQSPFSLTNPVVIYSDGVPQNSTLDYDVMLENAERIEVLRGPQGTLYGKSSIGGVINVISKEPENDWSGSAGLEYGSDNHLRANANTNGALIDDKLFLGIGVVGETDDGWVHNDYNDSDANDSRQFKLNSTLTATPTDRLTARLTLGAKNQETNFINGAYNISSLTAISRDDAENASFDMPSYTDVKSFSQALNIDYDFDNFTFSSLTTHKSTDIDGLYDVDFSYDAANSNFSNGLYMVQDVDLGEVSQEFKLASNNEDSRLRWVAGVYFDKEDTDRTNGFQFYFPPVQSNFERQYTSQTNSRTLAVFGQADYDLTDALTLTLGGRYQKTDKDIDLASYTFPVGTGQASSIASFSIEQEASWHDFLPKAALSYAINDDISTYISYSQGTLPGGFNFFPASASADIKFDEQTADNYEIGIRGNFLDDKLTLGAAVFYIDIDDIQQYETVTRNGGNLTTVSNGGAAESKGIELDATYRINENWTVNGALGLTHAKYTQNTNNSYNGNRIELTPKYTANLGVAYYHPEGFYGRLDINAQGSTYFDAANQFKQSAWATADLRLGYLKDDFNIYGYINNISNEEHVVSYQSGLIEFNDPRSIGVGMKYSF